MSGAQNDSRAGPATPGLSKDKQGSLSLPLGEGDPMLAGSRTSETRATPCRRGRGRRESQSGRDK